MLNLRTALIKMWVKYFIFWRGPTWHCEELLFEKRGERRVLDTFSQDMESRQESRRDFGKCEGNTFLESQISSPIEKAQFVLMNYYFVWDGSLEQMVFYLGKKKLFGWTKRRWNSATGFYNLFVLIFYLL